MRKSQREKVLEYLKKYSSITPLDALREFNCMRLATRIFELRAQGYNIKAVIERSKNKSGEPVHYARYILEGAEVEHRGYMLQQSYNWHYMIIDKARQQMVLHASCTEPLTEQEAKECIDRYLLIL